MPTTKHRLHFQIHYEDDAFWATVDEYPGVFAVGDDLEELRASIEEGICLMEADPGGEPVDLHLSDLRLGPSGATASAELVY
jgi:predicted RNase H-like HicB family nuclease